MRLSVITGLTALAAFACLGSCALGKSAPAGYRELAPGQYQKIRPMGFVYYKTIPKKLRPARLIPFHKSKGLGRRLSRYKSALAASTSRRRRNLSSGSGGLRGNLKSLARRQRQALKAVLAGGGGKLSRVYRYNAEKSRTRHAKMRAQMADRRAELGVKTRKTAFTVTPRHDVSIPPLVRRKASPPQDRRERLANEVARRKAGIKPRHRFASKTRILGPPPPFLNKHTRTYSKWVVTLKRQ